MANSTNEPRGCQPACYQIKIMGKFRENWSDWLNGMEISTQENGEAFQVTTLVGVVPDQAALRGILCKMWDLNLTILSILRIEPDAGKKASEQNE